MAKTVLILCGGRSDEHEISLISAIHVLKALDRSRYSPLVIGISKQNGTWFLENEDSFFQGEARADKIRLNEHAPKVSLSPFSHAGRGKLNSGEKESEFDVVFPILHGPFGEDGTIQGLFDIVGVPYVGANCGSSWICMDKMLTKVLCNYYDIRTTDFICVSSVTEVERREREITLLGDTLFVKPCRLGSSVGITKVSHRKKLEEAVELALYHDSKCLIERAIVGREIECAVLGLNQSPKVAMPGEIVPNKKIGFYSYEAKYLLKDGAELHAPAKLDPSQVKRAQDFSLRVFKCLECDGMARIDLFLEEKTGNFLLNEANTIPGFTPISMFPKLWQVSGLTYSELISELIELAFKRLSVGLIV